MNIVKSVIERIEAYRKTNKKPCKSYATEERAEAIGAEKAAQMGKYFCSDERPGRYIVAYNVAWGRWIVAFDMSEMAGRSTFQGGYIGWAAQQGFFTF